MHDSMHILDQLRERGYEPQEDVGPGEDWFDRYFGGNGLRVVLTDDEVRLYGFSSRALEWGARFTDGTPSSVLVAALDAAEREAGGQAGPARPGHCAICGRTESAAWHQGWADPEGGHEFTLPA